SVADVAVGVIAAIAGIGVPIDRAVRLNLVGRVSLLIEIFAVLVLDRRWITGSVGESISADSEQNRRRGHKADDTQEPVLDYRWRVTRRVGKTHAPERGPSAHCCGSANTVSVPPSAV